MLKISLGLLVSLSARTNNSDWARIMFAYSFGVSAFLISILVISFMSAFLLSGGALTGALFSEVAVFFNVLLKLNFLP